MEEKEGFWGKVKKKLTKKAIFNIVCILVLITLVFTARNIIQKAIDETIVYVMNAARLMTLFDEDENEEVEIYNIDTSVGVDGCKLRPKTGVYPGTSGSSGSGTSNGSFPSGVKTIQQLLDEEKAAGLITDSTNGVSDRGKTKSMMGWQTLGGLSHSSHTSSSAVINYGKSGALQHRFVISLKQGTKDINADIPKTITKGEITWFDELGFGKVEGRYTVAIKQDLGTYIWGKQTQIGDYIDVYLDSGTIINCVVADVKARENKSNIVHQDGSIVEFVTNVHKFYGCCNGTGKHVAPVSVKPEFNQPILGIVKVGSYWTNPECQEGAINGGTTTTTPATPNTPTTTEEVTTLPDGTEIPPGYAFLDSNGQPCTPDGATTGGAGGGGSWADNFGATPGRRTIKNYLQHALSAMGRVTYMYGGGQGNGPNYVLGFDKLLPTYKDYHDRNIENKEKYKNNRGLDCCGYVKWVVYNTFHTEEGKHDTDGGVASEYDNSLANKGYGKIVHKNKNWSSVDLKPGDIVSSGPHIWTIIGKSENGGYVMIHSSQTGELVRLGGTSGTGAVNTAKKYNDIVNTASTEVMGNTPVDWFPEGAGQGSGKFTRGGDSYKNKSTEVFRWNYDSTGLEDPDGILNMSAEQILELLIGDGRGTPENATSSGSTGKKVFIDPGHGPSTFNDAQMTAAGYSKNSSGQWGEWRHYDSSGKVGTNCNNCKKDASHNCWYPFANALRDKEPELTYAIATELSTILQSRGYEVAMSRNASEHPSIGKRAKDAHDFGASIQVCIHCNAGGGSGVAYCSPAGGGYGTNSYKLSDWQTKSLDLNKKILNGIKAKTTFSLYNSGVINNYGYLILYEKASCPTAYLEIGFYDNASDLSKLQNEKNKIAEGIADGIDAYFK